MTSPISRNISLANKNYLYFGGTAYLGIPQNKAFYALYLEGLNRFGLNNGTSRSNNVQLDIYNQAEQFAATYFGAATALITSSGYLAAQLTIRELAKTGEVRYAPATHPALWLNDPPQTTGSFTEWSKRIIKEINESNINRWVIISNSLNNLYPELYDFSFAKEIDVQKKVVLIVDDSHGIGITHAGKGIFPMLPQKENLETVVIASMAKALGVDAGLVLGGERIISQLKETNTFLGASPPAAAGLFAFMNASSIYQEEHQKLMHSTSALSENFKGNGQWTYASHFPVFLSSQPEIEEKLKKEHVLISSFAYPDKNGSLINRLVVSSWHTPADIEELILALRKINS